MPVPEEISRSRYVSLTTYRRDGTPVSTPVWHAVYGDGLAIISDLDTGKVKRIRRDGRVTVTVCDFRGRTAPDAPSATGTARLLDDVETRDARALIARKYLMSRLGNGINRVLRIRRRPVIGIAVALGGQ